MFPEKSDLVDHINTTIKKKWCKEASDVFAYDEVIKALKSQTDFSEKNRKFFEANSLILGNLGQRIEALENLNDYLLRLMNFLVENLPSVVINALNLEKETAHQNSDQEKVTSEENLISSKDLVKEKKLCPTRREMDILQLLIKGLCAKEIANRLFISAATVITHKKNLKEKFKAKNTVELISKALTFC